MAEAALVRDMQVPNGGIADFVMSDEDIEAVYGPDEDEGAEEYGTEGLGQFTEVANQMAEKGRYGDDTIAHLESGELVIPKAFLEQDPEMAETLFAYLESMGIEDPQRYVVGSDSNSINPETGLPEFFYKKIKKAFKKAGKTIKKVAKKVSKIAKPVIKVIQKVAPIVLPMALSATPLGPVFGAALGSGIASLINGGSLKDAFKKALIGGAMGAAGAGFRSLATGGGFMEGITGAVSNPVARFGQTFTGAQNSLTRLVGGAVAPEAPGFFGKFVEPVAQSAGAGFGSPVESVREAALSGSNIPNAQLSAEVNPLDSAGMEGSLIAGPDITPPVGTAASNAPVLDAGFSSDFVAPELPEAVQAMTPSNQLAAAVQPYQRPSMIESLSEGNFKEAFLPSGPTPEQVQLAKNAAYTDAYKNAMSLPGMTSQNASLAAMKAAEGVTASSLGPSLTNQALRIAAPIAGTFALTEATGLTNFTKAPPQEELELISEEDGFARVEADPSNSMLAELGNRVLNPETGEYELVQNLYPSLAEYTNYTSPTSFQYNFAPVQSVAGGPFQRPEQNPVFAAEGGHIFPRRNGGIMPNEGIPGRDSVRAMLMPGEFVMTTDAVRGAGDGSLNRGIKNMYSVMRDLESRGRRMA